MRFENYDASKLLSIRTRVYHPATLPRTSPTPRCATARVRPLPELRTSLRARPKVLGRETFPSRCRQKACVFPAQLSGCGECAYHRRQSLEPDFFQSMQPSSLLLDQAKFGLPDSEPEDGRVRDRHRLAAERVRFILGDAAC